MRRSIQCVGGSNRVGSAPVPGRIDPTTENYVPVPLSGWGRPRMVAVLQRGFGASGTDRLAETVPPKDGTLAAVGVASPEVRRKPAVLEFRVYAKVGQ